MNRRKFLKTGLGGALVLAGGGVAATRLWPGRSPAGPVREIRLNARIADWQVGPGASTRAWTYNGQVPGPEIRVREGERLRVVLTNELPEPTTLHWHGLPVPYAMDGVPDLTQAPVQPGERFTYEFTAGSPGTYWYHSHVGYQFDRGLYAPLIVEPHRESLSYDREYVLVFDDWLFDPEHPEPDPAMAMGEVHQSRWMKLAREGGQMTGQHLRKLEPERRRATLVAVVLDTRATLIDETIELHERVLGSLFSRAKQRHAEQFQQAGRSINEKVRLYSKVGRALVTARREGADPFRAIEAVLPWERFAASVVEAEHLAQPESFDHLHLIGDGYAQLRRYVPVLLGTLEFRAAPVAADVLQAVEVLRRMYAEKARAVPADAPTGFIRKRWAEAVFAGEGIDRRYYELCVLSVLKDFLRSGDMWIPGSRQFKDFEEYLITPAAFQAQLVERTLGVAVETECEAYLEERLLQLEATMERVEALAARGELPDARFQGERLKLSPLTNTLPDKADVLIGRTGALLPHLKITDLLLEVDQWTGFTRHFTHLKSGAPAENKQLLLSAILADGINLGLSKMAESSPGTTYARLSWLNAWHIREETYRAALGELVNAEPPPLRPPLG